MDFEYNHVITSSSKIKIEDIGNCSIKITTIISYGEVEANYYLILHTSLGSTQVFKYGPLTPSIELLPRKVECSFERIKYNVNKLYKVIDDFLNNPKMLGNVMNVELMDRDEALNECKSIIEYMKNFDEGEHY